MSGGGGVQRAQERNSNKAFLNVIKEQELNRIVLYIYQEGVRRSKNSVLYISVSYIHCFPAVF